MALNTSIKSQSISALLTSRGNFLRAEKAIAFNDQFTGTTQNIDYLPGPTSNNDHTTSIPTFETLPF